MSTSARANKNSTKQCCRTCTGNVYAVFVTINIPPDPRATSFDLKGVEGPHIKKSCDGSLSSQADLRLHFELQDQIHNAVLQRINALVSVGYYLENGKRFKGGAAFEAEICTDNGEISVNITSFKMHTFA